MGGGIAILATMPGGPLHGIVRGVCLLAPLCKIADDMMMSPWKVSQMKEQEVDERLMNTQPFFHARSSRSNGWPTCFPRHRSRLFR